MMVLLMLMVMTTMVHAQIKIGGNIYGGGNAGYTGGSTKVTVHAGDLNEVYGGARMANVGGAAFVHIDGEHASDNIFINNVYGGNDIAGSVGSDNNNTDPVPSELTEVGGTDAGKNAIDNSWDAYIRTSPTPEATNRLSLVIGSLFGGGNGDYDYEHENTTITVKVPKLDEQTGEPTGEEIDEEQVIPNPYYNLQRPELGKTYLEILGGCIAHLYGGGNNATVTANTTICINNNSPVLTQTNVWPETPDPANADAVAQFKAKLAALAQRVGLSTFQSDLSSYAFNFARVFGGNNKADMAIRPKWNLQAGVIRDLYSGGNQGAMTYEKGILLSVNPAQSDKLKIENVFGGCRMADVNPAKKNIPAETIDGTFYPAGYAARVLIEGGDITNVYGGNDISGNIYGGNAVGIHSSIKGDVYGGGNGSYAYTDNAELGAIEAYKDFYYNPDDVLAKAGRTASSSDTKSVEALNLFRPNAESVSLRLLGTAAKPTIIGGAVYCGGNSATLHNETAGVDAAAELKIGSYVIADKVFLGNNGANMVKTDEKDDVNGIPEGVLRTLRSTVTGSANPYNSMNLKDKDQFDKYMDGVAMDVMPRVVFDDIGSYVPYSTMFGSFYCGGNVGSMKINGAIDVSFNDKVVVFDKVVGGSNEANVYESAYNAQYLGGLLGATDTNGNKLILNFGGLKIQPKRWINENDKSQGLEWNTVDGRTYDPDTKKYTPMASVTPTPTDAEGNITGTVEQYDADTDLYRRFHGGNIYGGCYSNGHVEGNVVINLNASLVDRKGENAIFDEIEENEGEAKLYDGNYNIKKRYTGVLLGEQGMDVLGRALNVFGGGYGGDSEIWGSATINLNAGYTFQIFGGGEQGAIGRAVSHEENATNPNIHDLTYEPNEAYSTYINLRGSDEGVYRGHTNDKDDMAEAEFIYGGSFEGLIAGSTHINLGNGRIFNSFAGSCNADILGHTETYIGRQANNDGTYTDGGGFPWIRDHVYGGNDLGGHIFGLANFKGRVSSDALDKIYNPIGKEDPDVTNASAYMEYLQGRVENIYGGCYGVYDYKDSHFKNYTYTTGDTETTDSNIGTAKAGFTKPRMVNAFTNFRPINHTRNAVNRIYGAGQGYSGDSDRDVMQDRSYVLIDMAQNNTKYQDMEVFGAGDFCGLGMRNEAATKRTVNNEQVEVMSALDPTIAEANADGVTASTVIDLVRGQIGAAYGASCNEGITRRTIVNVPVGSTIKIGSIFGGAYGSDAYKPCDVYEAHVNYLTQSEDAYLISNPATKLTKGAIYGGNNYARRTLYGQINIGAPVRQQHPQYGMTTATIYGAGCGSLTWNEYTEVNLKDGAQVWEVYGGGEAGSVMSAESVQAYLKNYKPTVWPKDKDSDPDEPGVPFTDADWLNAWSLGGGYDPVIEGKTPLEALKEGYVTNTYTNLANPLVRVAEMDDRDTKTYRYNTNVIINKGAYVGNYAYGGGLGNADDAFVGSGDVYGTTYIALLGGVVNKDLYAAGTSGAVYNIFGAENLTASSNAYIAGGSARNVYGGGWKGSVGYHVGDISSSAEGDILGETHVVIGIRPDQADENLVNELKKVLGKDNATKSDYGFYAGVPAIQRNAYGGGEGGSIIGQANLTLNNGYIGYIYNSNGEYEEKVNDETWTDHVGEDRLSDCGNLFGGGYDDNSSVDESHITMWGGTVRNTIFGGGEIATIGRGATKEGGVDNKDRTIEAIYKAGKTHIEMYNGHVKRNVFGGGKGYNILGYGGVHGFYTDGYVFGGTEVYIHGGEIGTDEGLAEGYGNVFGGGDVGFVYSKGYFNPQTINGKTSNPGGSTGSPNHWYYYDEAGNLTEDCKVVVTPMLQVKKNGTPVDFGDETYNAYDYVPTDYLNTLPADKSDSRWKNLYTGDKITNDQGETVVNPDDPEERGIHIHNAVFGGGNVSSNSESYSNATTVFGNTTATLYDVYHHDFITVGTEHTGGLYGGGNLSLVGGYRELNITNYGTDYYGLDQQISLEEYRKLTNRERAYFKLEYLCQQDVSINGKNYKQNDRISEDEYNALPSDYRNTTYWVQYGFCSIYAGRLLNTIQRADFCGVYGSRLVMQGAKDRVADVADATEYTINRIGEVSLNQQRSVIPSDLTLKSGVATKPDPDDYDPEDYENWQKAIHGNYFGIYSVVNYLGALTSDVHFDDNRRYVDKGQTYVDDANTYYKWKEGHLQKRDRNNGTSLNQVALASGVYLELTSEKSTPNNKIYGDITGIVELDLINVKKDIEGGGYVYARNEHGARSYDPTKPNVLLSEYNKQKEVGGVTLRDEARTHKRYTYTESTLQEMQTSGNFIHKSKRIVDDCYPNNGIYKDGYVKSPAHYWFIKGEVYIYDQVVSAYAGSASAYSKEVKIPLTITAGSNGRLKLLNVQPNLYAYYGDQERTTKIGSDGVKVDNESMTYKLNDVITWWDWNQLAQNEQNYFVKETYVNVDPCVIDGEVYEAGAYVLENDASIHDGNASQTAWKVFQTAGHTVKDAKDDVVTDLSKLFRSSNNISHETGYVLTLDMNSPKDWDDWYSPINGTSEYSVKADGTVETNRKSSADYNPETDKNNYLEGPTYRLTGNSGLYGQREYRVGEIITKEIYDDYNNTVGTMHFDDQATAEPAYVSTVAYGNIQAGNAIGETEWSTSPYKSNYQPAMVCINTIQLGDEEYVLMGDLVSGNNDDLTDLARKYMTYNNKKINADQITEAQALEYIKEHLSNAYYIKSDGLYGGQYFQSNTNYGAIKSWCSLTDDRDNFSFNYDAFDVLVDSEYLGEGYTETSYHRPYSDVKPVEYDAVYNGTGTLTYYDNDNTEYTIESGGRINREAYEKVRNDQMHYTRIQVAQGSDKQTVYIVNETMIDNGTPYAKGQDISEKDFKALSTVNKNKVDVVEFQKGAAEAIKYYCYENYTPSPTSTFNVESGTAGQKGSVISEIVFNDNTLIPNYQKEFSIQGAEPTETTTLYVSRESNARDVTSEKVISVVYQYTYYEADDEGEGVGLVNELHVLNIHLQLESGAPEIGPLTAPPTVLPGNSVGLKAPSVNPGLYEILTSGWELFNSEDDAQLHRNGVPFVNNGTPLYWYQNEKVFLAFYSKTYLGKTYSNYVPLTVANYHDLDAIMKDKQNHLYVDHPDVMRNSKIYIDNRDCESDQDKSELDLLKDFFDLSLQTEVATTGATKDHALLNSRVKGGGKLEFILNSDVSPKAYADWTPIGNADGQCFEGNFHGDGYTISGLNKSLFGKLCGNVYNLGVTGSFTSAGVADTGGGYVENCWVKSTATSLPDGTSKVNAVFGNPSDDTGLQVVNSYFWTGNAGLYNTTTDTGTEIITSGGDRGTARAMTDREFYNGTVAYNLNGFLLNKRFYDNNTSWDGTNKKSYEYLMANADGTLPEEKSTGYYPSNYAYYPLDATTDKKLYGYVEERYHDGDFIYAGGTIPEAYDDRMRVTVDGDKTVVVYAPIWPDDYIYFGQMLTYDFNGTHQDEPSSVSKSGGRITANGNRVYRAPAYYGSSEMGVAHFNSNASIFAYSKKKTVTDTNLKEAYPGMTAIDFAGHNDNSYKHGLNGKLFYQPLLDDDGLQSFSTEGETQNLLVYAPAETAESGYANMKTYTVLNDYFTEPAFADYYDEADKYRRVQAAPESTVHGHLVQGDLMTTADHLLVDKQDFYCPIRYDMGEGYRMWYQRKPDNFVDSQKGWEAVSLPFSAELVTTQDKGEITHFYQGSTTSHEYWLREYKGKADATSNDANIFIANMSKPDASSDSNDSKDYTNTFLWDYYYSKDSYLDKNEDEYQKIYYKDAHTYSYYPYAVAGTPYIIGLPGARYYEFDLSGEWTPVNRYNGETIASPGRQNVTFVSATGISIENSNTDMEKKATYNGFTFMPCYTTKNLETGKAYLLNADGSSFEKNTQATTSVPFRPYFTGTPQNTRSIIFGNEQEELKGEAEHGDPKDGTTGTLRIWAKKDKIFVESSLSFTEDLRVVTPAGITVATFTVKPGQTVEVDADFSGMYIVHTLDGLYMKKVVVKRE